MNINQVWPEWNEDCLLGEGSFGKVYKAKRVEYGRTFYSAIKVITVPKSQQEIRYARSQGMNDQEIYNYFRGLVDNLLNEITLMDNLKGAKNIVGIEDYKIIQREGEIGWDIFIRMELLTPFDSFVSNPEFSQKDVIKLGVDLCSALEICEQNYIVHRDIKPDNIFISRFGEFKLGDFGIARKLETTQANLSRKGTLNYMAPEVYKSEEYGSNVDIYSLGLVLYTLLNNNRVAFLPPYPQPISYKDNEEALSKRLSGMPPVPPCNAGASLGATILKACAYHPQDRYQTATEFKNALIAEWNVLIQSGNDQGIGTDVMCYEGNIDQKLQNTTNDMTANGRLVVDGFDQGTTVLNQSGAMGYQAENGLDYTPGNQYPAESVTSGPTRTSLGGRICRVLAWPMALTVCVLAIILILNGDGSSLEGTLCVSMLGVGVTVLLADRNKGGVGLSVAALSGVYIIEGLSMLVGELRQGVPVWGIVLLLSGALLFFGGIVILTQKEVKSGASLCAYSIAVEWLFHAYQMINGSFEIEAWNVYYAIAAAAVFVWVFGYRRDEKKNGLKIVAHIVTYLAAAFAFVRVVIFALTTFAVI